jgi:hypothetical protein
MRLIDADDFKKFLQALCNAGAPYDEIIKLLEKQPTAYDVEKVAEELGDWHNHYDEGLIAVHEAIDIVRKGGVDNDA